MKCCPCSLQQFGCNTVEFTVPAEATRQQQEDPDTDPCVGLTGVMDGAGDLQVWPDSFGGSSPSY